VGAIWRTGREVPARSRSSEAEEGSSSCFTRAGGSIAIDWATESGRVTCLLAEGLPASPAVAATAGRAIGLGTGFVDIQRSGRTVPTKYSKILTGGPAARIWKPEMARETSVAAPAIVKNKVNRRADAGIESANGRQNYASGGAPLVPVVQSPDLRYRHHSSELRRLHGPWLRCVLFQREVWAGLVIIGKVN
jgi:hypothetical protein